MNIHDVVVDTMMECYLEPPIFFDQEGEKFMEIESGRFPYTLIKFTKILINITYRKISFLYSGEVCIIFVFYILNQIF